MRNLEIVEASKHYMDSLPLRSSIYKNGSHTYSNFKNLVLSKEISLHKLPSENCGIIPEIQAYWFCTKSSVLSSSYDLNICRYDLNSVEVLPSFTTSIRFIKAFKPIKGIFNSKVVYCLFILTEGDAFIYGIENDTNNIINTDFSCKLTSQPTCLEINKGRIFVGTEEGGVYQAIYKSIDILNYKFLNLYSPGNTLIKALVGFFKRRSSRIVDISVREKYLVAILSNKIETYRVDGCIYKLSTIEVDTTYQSVQIIEENPLSFYCVNMNGVRDFFTLNLEFSFNPPIQTTSQDIIRNQLSQDTIRNQLGQDRIGRKNIWSTDSSMLLIQHIHDKSLVVFTAFNENQQKNFCKSNPVENFEILSVYQPIYSVSLSGTSLFLLLENRILCYDILNTKRFMLNCKPDEIYMIYKNYGEREFMIKYFELLTENEDVSKLEGLCKSDNSKTYYLFLFIYQLISPIWKLDISMIYCNSNDPSYDYEIQARTDKIIKKMKNLRSKLRSSFSTAVAFLDEFIQTNFYCSLLSDYQISYSETFESILTKETDFKDTTLKALLDLFTLNLSIEPLIKTMQNNCPIYLPLEHINMQRGLQLLKNGDRDSLYKSLEFFTQSKFDSGVVRKFNELKFYFGSTSLIKKYFDFNYETAVDLFKLSVRCKKALECALNETSEAVLYPLFEALISNDDSTDTQCICCGFKNNVIDLVKIEHPLFLVFLKDHQNRCSDIYNEKIYTLYWKYLLFRNRKIEATEALLNLCHRKEISLAQKYDFLQTALSISTGTHLNSEVKMKLKLYQIQDELMRRVPAMRTSNLLDYNTLYNDYAYNHPDLSLKILDSVNCKDVSLFKEGLMKLFNKFSIRDCMLIIKDSSNRNISLVTRCIVEREPDDLCYLLEQAGFNYEEVIQAAKNALNLNSKPETMISVLKSLRKYSKNSEFKECETFCEKSFGIKI